MHSFSIIVPLYNSATFLNKCIQSIRAQNYHHYEVILVDDGSQDNTLELCQNYASEDSRIQVFTKSNEGQGAARNYGFAKAVNDFILYVDSDDYLEPDTLLSINTALSGSPNVDIVNFQLDFVDSVGKSYHQVPVFKNQEMVGEKIFLSAMLDDQIISSPCNKAYRRSFLAKHNITFPVLRKNEDILYSRTVGFFCQHAIFINRTFYHALIRTDSTSRTISVNNLRDSLETISKIKSFLEYHNVLNKYELVFKAFVVRHLSYLLIISAFRIGSFNELRDLFQKTAPSQFNCYARDKNVVSLLNTKQKIMVWLCRNPLLLYISANSALKLKLYNPGR